MASPDVPSARVQANRSPTGASAAPYPAGDGTARRRPSPVWGSPVARSLVAGLYLIGFGAPAFEALLCHVGETVEDAAGLVWATRAKGKDLRALAA